MEVLVYVCALFQPMTKNFNQTKAKSFPSAFHPDLSSTFTLDSLKTFSSESRCRISLKFPLFYLKTIKTRSGWLSLTQYASTLGVAAPHSHFHSCLHIFEGEQRDESKKFLSSEQFEAHTKVFSSAIRLRNSHKKI